MGDSRNDLEGATDPREALAKKWRDNSKEVYERRFKIADHYFKMLSWIAVTSGVFVFWEKDVFVKILFVVCAIVNIYVFLGTFDLVASSVTPILMNALFKKNKPLPKVIFPMFMALLALVLFLIWMAVGVMFYIIVREYVIVLRPVTK